MENSIIKACIFDLDGVIVDTAHYHYLAWRKMANLLGFDLSQAQNENLKGVSRKESIEYILKLGKVSLNEKQTNEYLTLKNNWYLEYIQEMTPAEILPGVIPFLEDLKANNIACAIGSSSKNARPILEKVNLTDFFSVIVDGTNIVNGKPDPEVFLKASVGLKLSPSECLVVEDAIAGVEAALNGNFPVLAIGDEKQLKGATINIGSTEMLNISLLQSL